MSLHFRNNKVMSHVIDPEEDQGGAKQEFKNECDINFIIDKYQSHGVAPSVAQGVQQFIDVDPIDYQEALNLVIAAQDVFSQVPSDLRAICKNDPALFLKYVSEPENEDMLIKHGLIQKVPIVSDSGGVTDQPRASKQEEVPSS